MAYIGKEPIVGNFQKCDAISVVNGQAAYTLQVSSTNVTPESANHMLVSLNGILQAPTTSFTVSGSTLTFASNLITGDVIDFVMLLGNVLDLGVPSDSTVSLAKLTATGTKDATTFLRGDNTFAEAGGGKVLQVLQTVKTDTFSTSTALGSFTDVTGMSQAITPSATSSKILVTVCGHFTNQTSNYSNAFRLVRDSTSIFIGDSRGSSTRASSGGTQSGNGNMRNFSFTFLDSPNTTSSTTYKLQAGSESGGTLFLGGTYLSSNALYQSAPASITVTEIGA